MLGVVKKTRLPALFVVLLTACSGVEPGPPGAERGSVDGTVVERGVAVPMRDGVVLRADVYRPPGDGPLPVLVYRTPYGRQAAADSLDTDLWVTLLDVGPDGAAYNLMSPGSNVLRASYRDLSRGRRLLEPGRIYRLTLDEMPTAHRFAAGHRIRALVSTSFAPYLSRNLHTGGLESVSARGQKASVRVHHDAEHPSRLRLPVVGAR